MSSLTLALPNMKFQNQKIMSKKTRFCKHGEKRSGSGTFFWFVIANPNVHTKLLP
jgi:hypothetical protein